MSNNTIITTGASAAASPAETPVDSPIALFVQNVLQLNNGALAQIADYLEAQPAAVRMRFIERCGNLISAVADPHA
jgi:hypothetical protein